VEIQPAAESRVVGARARRLEPVPASSELATRRRLTMGTWSSMLLVSPASQGPTAVESDAACPGSATPSGAEMTFKHMLHCIQSGPPGDSYHCSASSSVNRPPSCVEGNAHRPRRRFAMPHVAARCPDAPYRLRNSW
jgi:hypothetical protein